MNRGKDETGSEQASRDNPRFFPAGVIRDLISTRISITAFDHACFRHALLLSSVAA